jgi:exonuclease III
MPVTASLGSFRLTTQNVRGFSKRKRRAEAWFDDLREKLDGRHIDAILLQETRATKNWAEKLQERYAHGWGFKAAAEQLPLSHWTSTKRAAGGVAILLHPQSTFRTLQPIWEDMWGPHCLALSGDVAGLTVTLVCVYAPTDRPAREALYSALSKKTPPTGIVLVGGDFNCTLDAALDRSHHAGDVHDSPKLQHLLSRWRIVDSAASNMLAAMEGGHERDFHSRTHSYRYRLADGSRASSRLDRWYVSNDFYDNVRATTVSPPCSQSDHDAVTLEFGHLDHRRQKRTGRRAVTYPVPHYAAESVRLESDQHLTRLQDLAGLRPDEAAIQWDALKDQFRVNALRAQRRCTRKLRGSYRQRLRRLRAQLRTERARESAPSAEMSLVDQFDLLCLDPAARQNSIRAAIISTREAHAAARKRRKFDVYAGHAADATRAFYRRISVKYQGRRSTRTHQLPTASGQSVAAKLAEDWVPILQQQPPTESERVFSSTVSHPRRDGLCWKPAHLSRRLKSRELSRIARPGRPAGLTEYRTIGIASTSLASRRYSPTSSRAG